MRTKRPRLHSALYIGLQRYFLTFCTAQRREWFVDAEHVDPVRERILQTATAFDMEVIAHGFMPDHVHLLIEGLTESADACAFVHQAKQLSAYTFKRLFSNRVWQPSFYDRILRDDEASISVARYIFENPVVAGLVTSPEEYPFLGSQRYAIREILEAVRWQP